MTNLRGIKVMPSGEVMNFYHPETYNYTEEEIAKLLVKVKRFNGVGLSAASHSVYVADVLWYLTNNPHIALRGLIHDAHEAYVGDLSSPIKDVVGVEWEKLEGAIQTAIERKLGLCKTLSLTSGELIKIVDTFALVREVEHLLSEGKLTLDKDGIWESVINNTKQFTLPDNLRTIEEVSSQEFIQKYDFLNSFVADKEKYTLAAYMGRSGKQSCLVAIDVFSTFTENFPIAEE